MSPAALRNLVSPTKADAATAAESVRFLAARTNGSGSGLRLAIQNGVAGEEFVLPAPAVALLLELLTELGRGNAVTFDTLPEEISTRQAAELLNVSTPYVEKLLDAGTLPFRDSSGVRRVRREDVLEFKRVSNERSLKAMEELAAQAQELGMGY